MRLWTSRVLSAERRRHCVFCREPLQEFALRVDNGYYCNELCADAAAGPLRPADHDVTNPPP